MTNEQAQQVLDEMQGVRPEQLNDEAKRLFEAIMKIADERDKIKQEYDRDTHILQNQLDLANAKNIEKDKIIDLMLDEITNSIVNTCPLEDYNYDLDCENRCNDNYKECWKKYFENKSREV